MAKPTRLDYCQYLLSSPLNYTLTHFADHSDRFTHDMLNRYLGGDRVSPLRSGKTSNPTSRRPQRAWFSLMTRS